MTAPDPRTIQTTDDLIGSIRSLREPVESLAASLRDAIERLARTIPDRRVSADYWVLVAHADAAERCRLFTEQNFAFIETIGLLAVTRYLFELVVWLKLMEHDNRYGLVYYHDLAQNQRRHYTDLRDHLKREVAVLKELHAEEERLDREHIAAAQRRADPEARAQAMQAASTDVPREVDAKAARAFLLYGEQARTNGYGFQAFLVEKKVLPQVEEQIRTLDGKIGNLDKSLPADVRPLISKRWNWRDLGVTVGMENDYKFIYTYTSRLLHATPASLTTNQKNLTHGEVRVFLKYCHVRLLDVIDMARNRLSVAQGSGDQ